MYDDWIPHLFDVDLVVATSLMSGKPSHNLSRLIAVICDVLTHSSICAWRTPEYRHSHGIKYQIRCLEAVDGLGLTLLNLRAQAWGVNLLPHIKHVTGDTRLDMLTLRETI
jgi:hypothetical protein